MPQFWLKDTINAGIDRFMNGSTGTQVAVNLSINDTAYVQVGTWSGSPSGVFGRLPTSDQFPVSVSIAAVSGDVGMRYRLQKVVFPSTVAASGPYSPVFTGTGPKGTTLTLATTWAVGDELRLSIEITRLSGHGGVSLDVNTNQLSSVTYTSVVAVAGAVTFPAVATASIEGTLVEPPGVAFAATAEATFFANRYPVQVVYPAQLVKMRTSPAQWALHHLETITLYDASPAGGEFNRADFGCPRAAGGAYVGHGVTGRFAPGDAIGAAVAIARVLPQAAPEWISLDYVPGAPADGAAFVSTAAMVEWNGGLYLSYGWWDNTAAQGARYGFSVDRLDLGTLTWSNVASQGGLNSWFDAAETIEVQTSLDRRRVYADPVAIGSNLYLLVRAGAQTYYQYGTPSTTRAPAYDVYRLTDAHALSFEATLGATSVLPTSTYGNQEVPWQPRRCRGFEASDGRPAWLTYSMHGSTGYAIVRLTTTPTLVRDHLSGLLSPNDGSDGHIRHAGNIVPFRTTAGRVGVVESTDHSFGNERDYLRVYDYVAGSAMTTRFSIATPAHAAFLDDIRFVYPGQSDVPTIRAFCETWLMEDIDYVLNGSVPDLASLPVTPTHRVPSARRNEVGGSANLEPGGGHNAAFTDESGDYRLHMEFIASGTPRFVMWMSRRGEQLAAVLHEGVPAWGGGS